ncbi:histidine kinase [Klebsiella aerogenes]|uniref:histidine kinase n=1 Tax=Klebsiella aerogenes TaxID=548 RepID=UPI001BD4BB2E|nr:histidine kinase [Klebsiella aerogenes]
MPLVFLLTNDVIRLLRYRPSGEKVYRKSEKGDGLIEEGKSALFSPLAEGQKFFKKWLKVAEDTSIPEGTVVDAVGKQARTF